MGVTWKIQGYYKADVVFPYETILSVIQTAGTYIGIGTQRKNGYGRYHIVEIQLIK